MHCHRNLHRDAIRVNTKRYGADSKTVAVDKANLAARLNSIGKSDEAQKIYLEVLDVYSKNPMIGDDLRMLAHAFEGYSQVLASQGKITSVGLSQTTALSFAKREIAQLLQKLSKEQ
jgi:hypothetical protein